MNSKIRRHMIATVTKRVLGLPFRKKVKDIWRLNQAESEALQRDIFLKMLKHARTNVPYYLANASSYPACEDTEHWRSFLQSLPILSKGTLRDANEQFVSKKRPLGTTFHTTSGTTGTPLKLWVSPLERAFADAIVFDWYRRIAHTKRYPPQISLSGFMTPSEDSSQLYWSAFGGRSIFLNMYALKEDHRDEICRILARYRKAMLYGYPSALAELARVVGDSLRDVKDRFVAVTSAEVLRPQYRESIESNLCSRVYDQYGSQEGCHLALECEAGNMHVHPLIGIVEILNGRDKPCNDGEMGRVIATGLLKRTMPLIRYELGDFVVAREGTCCCGLSWPLIGAIAGRDEDLVVTSDGRRVGHLDTVSTKHLNGIAESQLIQKAYDRFVYRIVMLPGARENSDLVASNERRIAEQLRRRLGYDLLVCFQYVDAIPREGGRSKFKAIVVEVEG
ncbi:MAG: hypothetical protein CEE38_23200 [Planctomycetes bacterium B3_Pla]|nr:MAG: hypothetical protein CEE38_23200 [Planctomycetes bacterium B3_Pla]